MSDIAIRVEGLSKKYRIGHLRRRHDTLRDQIAERVSRSARALFNPLPASDAKQNSDDIIWALRDVSFEVKRGEVVGIIGRNGAGKSTLLKILSRITEPTAGSAEIHGRLGTLLEVGTGFHPELTGRENIYLSGAIMGMKRAEIERRFDEIVAFAEVEKFIDTPVKHFSSGMYVRLAFAVAAHLEPEILLVDEVLAVGDAAFQKKCLGKMSEVASEGRTVLFVSHSMPMILRLCERAILLDRGELVRLGMAHEVATYYLSSGTSSPAGRFWDDNAKAPGDNVARLRSVRVLNQSGQLTDTFEISEPASIEVQYFNLQPRDRPTAILHLVNEEGVTLFATNDWNDKSWRNASHEPGLVKAVCKIPGSFLAEGRFFVLVAIGSYNPNVIHALEREAVSFQVVDRTVGDGARGEASTFWPGVLRPILEWQVTSSEPEADGV